MISIRPFYGEYAWAFDLLIDRPVTSVTELDPERHQLLVSETHTLVNDAGEHSSDYRFVMRCWTRSELESAFERGGFGSVEYFGAYDPAIHAGATDRRVAVASGVRRLI